MLYKLFYTCADKYTERNQPIHVYNKSTDVMMQKKIKNTVLFQFGH